eukprot:6420036-Ditylum_brightwellii.AAC.1
MSSTDQEDKKPETNTLLAENAITLGVHASKEDFDVGINATEEQCDSDIDKDDIIKLQSNSPNELTTFKGNVSAALMPL